MLIKRQRLFSQRVEEVEEQREYGAVKQANKAAKRAWMEAQGSRKGFLGIGKRSGDSAVKAGRDKLKSQNLNVSDVRWDNGKVIPDKYSLNRKINARGRVDGTHKLDQDQALNRGISTKAYKAKPEQIEIHLSNGKIISGRDELNALRKI